MGGGFSLAKIFGGGERESRWKIPCIGGWWGAGVVLLAPAVIGDVDIGRLLIDSCSGVDRPCLGRSVV